MDRKPIKCREAFESPVIYERLRRDMNVRETVVNWSFDGLHTAAPQRRRVAGTGAEI